MIKDNPLDKQIEVDKLHGMYRGVVEDNKDPEKMGRCKIRVWGVHTEKKNKTSTEGIPTEEIPWAEPALSIFGGGVSGVGAWTVPTQGSHVFLFFENGNILKPIYFASAPGRPTEKPDTNTGFNDPDGEYPKEDLLDEPDWNRLSRDEIEETIVEEKNDNLDEDVETAMGKYDWSEPESYYKDNEKYPNNNVVATKNGIIVEIDDSDEPRLHIYHPSNSYIEMDKDGNKVVRNNGDRYDIIFKNNYKHIKENENTTVDKDRTVKVKGDEFKEIEGDSEINRDGKLSITIGDDKSLEITGDYDIKTNGNCNLEAGGDCSIQAGGNCEIKAGGMANITASQVLLNS